MRALKTALIALSFVAAPTLADDSGPTPPLHVDPGVKDCEVRLSTDLSQKAYRRFVREFGTVSAFKSGAPPTTLGRWGVSASLEYMRFVVDEHASAWNDSFTHPDAQHELGAVKTFGKLKLRLGVAESTDLGVYFTMNPTSNYGWIGVDVKHAILRQTDEMPVTLSVRGAYTKTLFVGDMDMHALSAEALVGRTFWGVLTPYAGAGGDVIIARETAQDRNVHLDTEAVLAPHVLVGVEASYWHLALGAEAQYSALPSMQVQLSAVF